MELYKEVTMKSYLGLSHSIEQNRLDFFPSQIKRRKSVYKKNTLQSAEQLHQKTQESNGNFKKRLKRLNATKV